MKNIHQRFDIRDVGQGDRVCCKTEPNLNAPDELYNGAIQKAEDGQLISRRFLGSNTSLSVRYSEPTRVQRSTFNAFFVADNASFLQGEDPG